MAISARPSVEYTPPVVVAPRAAPGRLRKVGLLGSHTNSLVFAPWDDPSWELWGHASARGLYKRSPDVYFDLHRRECWTRRQNMKAEYPRWLAANRVPIYMQAKHPEVPASLKYPLEQVCMELPERYRYFTNHVAYMIALALAQGVTHIGLFGVNYGHHSEYQTQRGSAEFWLGVAHGRGVQLVLPSTSTLLQEPKALYGYGSHDEQAKLVPEYQSPVVATEISADGPVILRRTSEVPLATPPASVTADIIAAEEQEHPREAGFLGPLKGTV